MAKYDLTKVTPGDESLSHILIAACLAGTKGARKDDFLQKDRHPYLDTIFNDAVEIGQLEQDDETWRFRITEKGKGRLAYASGLLFDGEDLTPVPRYF